MTTTGSRNVGASRRAPGPSLAGRDPEPKSLSRRSRNEYFIRAHIYALPRILTHDSLDLINDRRPAFSTVLVGNQIADSVLVEDLLPVGRKALISSNSARQPAQLVGSYSEAKLLRDIDILLFGQREFAWVS